MDGATGRVGQRAVKPVTLESDPGLVYATSRGHIRMDCPAMGSAMKKPLATPTCAMLQVTFVHNTQLLFKCSFYMPDDTVLKNL